MKVLTHHVFVITTLLLLLDPTEAQPPDGSTLSCDGYPQSVCTAWLGCYRDFASSVTAALNCSILQNYVNCLINGCDSSACVSQFAIPCQSFASGYQLYGCTPQCPTSTTISPACQNPSGANCDFYTGCLETYVPCQNSPYAYAIPYGEYFCNLYSAQYNSFSASGQIWVDAVRKCLQMQLVPYLSSKPSCAALKDYAFASHVPCYTQPSPGVSICTLSPSDWTTIFWTIKGAIVREFLATLSQAVSTMVSCGKSYITMISVTTSQLLSVTAVQKELNSMFGNFGFQIPLIMDDNSGQKRSSAVGSYRIVVFGNTINPASDVASKIINATKSGTLNITGVTDIQDCKGPCDPYVKSSDAARLSLSLFVALLIIFNLSVG